MFFFHQFKDIKDLAMLRVTPGGLDFIESTLNSQAADLWEYHFDYKRWWQAVNSKEFKHYLRVKKTTRHFTRHTVYPVFGLSVFDYAPLSIKPHADSSNYGNYHLPWPDALYFTSEGTLGDYLFHHPSATAAELNSFFGYTGPMDESVASLTFFIDHDPAHPSVHDPNGVIRGIINYINWPVVAVGGNVGTALINAQPNHTRTWWIPFPFPHVGTSPNRVSTTFADSDEIVTDGFLNPSDVELLVPNWKSLVDARVLMNDDPLPLEPAWDNLHVYAIGNKASIHDVNYESLKNGNVGHPPNDRASRTWWKVVPFETYKHKKAKILSGMLYAPYQILRLFKAATKLRSVFFEGAPVAGVKDYRPPDFPSLPANSGMGYPMKYIADEDFNSPSPPNPSPPAHPNSLVPIGGSGAFLELIGGKEFAFVQGQRGKLLTQSIVPDYPIWIDGDGREQVVLREFDSSAPNLTWKTAFGVPVAKFHDVGEIFYIAP